MTVTMGSRFGVYEVLAPLGSGGMGEVYCAVDTRLGRKVALKALPDAMAADAARLARFEREAGAASSLNHPNNALQVAREIGARAIQSAALGNLAEVMMGRGDLTAAKPWLDEELAFNREISSKPGVASSLEGLSERMFLRGEAHGGGGPRPPAGDSAKDRRRRRS